MMRSKTIIIWVMVVTAILVPTATASSIVQSAHYDFGIDTGASSFGPQYMGGFFTPFDNQGGTRILERVTLMYGILASANVAVENEAGYPDMLSMTFTVHLGVTPWPSPVDMYNEYTSDLAATDGVPGSGPDFYDFGTLSVDGGGGYWETTSDLAWFSSGNPEDEFVFNGSAGITLDGPTVLTVSDLTASMNATLTYEYSVVPEPATVLLFGLGGLAAMRKRR